MVGSEAVDRGVGLRQFGEAEVENFYAAIFGDEQILGLEVAMDDAFFVGGGESVRDLHGVVESFAQGQRSAAQAVAQGLAFEQFGDDVGRAFVRADVEYGKDVGMIQGGGGQGLLLEAAQAVGVERERLRQDFDRNVALKARVAGAIDLAHASCAEQGNDFVGA